VGLDPGDAEASIARIEAAAVALRDGEGDPETVLGELLAGSVALARALGVDTESALRGWSARFKTHFEAMEQTAEAEGLDLHTLPPDQVEDLWRRSSVQ
jgi:uncharacterized protein YabN with tetrapyrrole methylase and pyrophosphatase domain